METNNPLPLGLIKSKENPRIKKSVSRKEGKSIKYFSFLNTLCCKFCIINPIRQKFIKLASKLVDKKLSIENILEVSNDLEILKKINLNDEQIYVFNDFPHLTFKEQLKEFKIDYSVVNDS